MSFNHISLNLINQQKSFVLYKDCFPHSFTKNDLVAIETNTSRVVNLQFTAKRLFELFYSLSLNGRGIWMSQETIAYKLGVSITTVKKALVYLRSLGIVSWASGRTDYKTNTYFVHMSLLKHEAVRILRKVFLCAQLAWYRRLIRFTGGISLLKPASFIPSEYNDLIEGCLPRNKNIYFNKPSSISSRLSWLVFGKKIKKEPQVNIRREVFERLKAQGFDFNDVARCDLQIFKADVVETAAKEYAHWSKTNKPDNAFKVFTKICHRLSSEGHYPVDSANSDIFKVQYGIEGQPNLQYIPRISTTIPPKTSSNGKTNKFTTFRDDSGVEWVRLPDGSKIRSRGQNYSPQSPQELVKCTQSPEFQKTVNFFGTKFMKELLGDWIE